MSEGLQFDLVSPEKLLVSKQVILVTLPGEMGAFGVLIGHVPMIAALKAGVVDIYETDRYKISERIFVAGGFAEVTGDRCTLLAEEAIPVADLNKEKLQKELEIVQDDLAVISDPAKRAVLEVQALLVRAKIDAVR